MSASSSTTSTRGRPLMALMVGRVRLSAVECTRYCQSPPQEASPCAHSLVASCRRADAGAASLGPDRARARCLRRLLRVCLLPRLVRRRGGGGAGRRHAFHVRGGCLRRAGTAVRGGRADRYPSDDSGSPSLPDRHTLLRGRAHARSRGRLTRPRPGRHTARGLPRRLLPRAPWRARGRVAVLGLRQALLDGGLAPPVHVPAARGRAAAHRRVDRRDRDRHARGGRDDDRARAAHNRNDAPAGRAARPAASAAGLGAHRATGAGGPRAGGACDPRRGAGARRGRALPGPVREDEQQESPYEELEPVYEEPERDEEPDGEEQLTPMGNRRSPVTESDDIDYSMPKLSFLKRSTGAQKLDTKGIERTGAQLVEALSHFNVEARLIGTVSGPHVTRYELRLAPGIKMSKVA